LDGRRYSIALLIQVAQEYRGQRQVSEKIHLGCFEKAKSDQRSNCQPRKTYRRGKVQERG
jgi:hypothetical protein